MKKSISKRIRITKQGKIMTRKRGQSHFLAKKTSTQLGRRSGMHALDIRTKDLNNF